MNRGVIQTLYFCDVSLPFGWTETWKIAISRNISKLFFTTIALEFSMFFLALNTWKIYIIYNHVMNTSLILMKDNLYNSYEFFFKNRQCFSMVNVIKLINIFINSIGTRTMPEIICNNLEIHQNAYFLQIAIYPVHVIIFDGYSKWWREVTLDILSVSSTEGHFLQTKTKQIKTKLRYTNSHIVRSQICKYMYISISARHTLYK